jgi:hypothetical protein
MGLIRRRSPFIVNKYEFLTGGEQDFYLIDMVGDKTQGLGVPAKSIAIRNHGGGSGLNELYFTFSENGKYWGATATIEAGQSELYDSSDNCIFWSVLLWPSNKNMKFSLRATPGYWQDSELRYYKLI